MEATAHQIRQRLDSIITFLTPLLPMANCHMVEFFTQSHWERLLPPALRYTLDEWDLNHAVEKFWTSQNSSQNEKCELTKWVQRARSHCLSVNNVYCLSREQLQSRIKTWGGNMKPEIRVKDFMSGKKSYEVQTMSHIVAALHEARRCSHAVEAGGGRGHLLVALSLGYDVPSLTVDRDNRTLSNAAERVKAIQKQWHAIASTVDGGVGRRAAEARGARHRFAAAFVTTGTQVARIVNEKFPEHSGDVRVLLTGLHTCGDLGPACLRVFAAQGSVPATLTVPCCYHLLSEAGPAKERGFPMSRHLRGRTLGRGARMLGSQALERVVARRQTPPDSLLYRALLQVIIEDHMPGYLTSEGRLKGVAPRCRDFVEYVKMADGALELDLFDRLPAGYLADMRRRVGGRRKEVVLFYLLRMCLAQVVESVILLDRLLYLMESGFESVYVVKLFDPVLSPRCHGIVAIR